jgi:hypothetical protein
MTAPERRLPKQHRKTTTRASTGQGIVEGAAGLVILFLVVVACFALLINVGVSSYYRNKLAFVANQTAIAAAQEGYDNDDATSVAKALLRQMGLKAKNCTAVVSTSQNIVSVTLSTDFPVLFSRAGNLPMKVAVKANGVAIATSSADKPSSDHIVFKNQQTDKPSIQVPVLDAELITQLQENPYGPLPPINGPDGNPLPVYYLEGAILTDK